MNINVPRVPFFPSPNKITLREVDKTLHLFYTNNVSPLYKQFAPTENVSSDDFWIVEKYITTMSRILKKVSLKLSCVIDLTHLIPQS